MRIDYEQGRVVIDGEAYLTIVPRFSTALSMSREAIEQGPRFIVRNHCFAFAHGRTRLGRWWHLCKQMWRFSA